MIGKIKITDNFYFTADSDQYILIECGKREKIDRKTRKPTGEIMDYEDTIGYYSSIEALIRGCRKIMVREKVSDGSLDTIDDIVGYMNNINDRLDEILSKIENYWYDTKILKSAHDTDTLCLYRWNYTIKVKVAEISSD